MPSPYLLPWHGTLPEPRCHRLIYITLRKNHLIDGPGFPAGTERFLPFATFGDAGCVGYRELGPRRQQILTTSGSGLALGFGSGALRTVGPMAPPAAASSTPRGPQNQFQHTEKWVTELVQTPGMSPVLTAGALLSKSSSLPSDHMVRV